MSDLGRRFEPSELGNGDTVENAEAAELLSIARDLEAYARSDSVTLSADFEDRVMTAIAAEPPPRPVASRGLFGIVTVVRDAWRLTWSGDRPIAVRAQAFALVLLAVVAVGSLGSLGVVGVGALLSPDGPVPTVAPAPTPSPSPIPTPGPSPSPSPSPTPSASPTRTAEPTGTTEPTERGDGTDDSSGSGSGSDSSGPGSGDDRTARPTD